MARFWMRNLRLKVAVSVAALGATFGIFGLVQANPFPGATSTSTSTPSPIGVRGGTDGGTATSSDSTQDAAPTTTPTAVPYEQPVQRSRVSRGS